MSKDTVQKYMFVLDRGGILTRAQAAEFRGAADRLHQNGSTPPWLKSYVTKAVNQGKLKEK